MDHIDFKILTILQEKARIPNVEVARQIGMAPSAVLERIKKLEARGIIDGYEVRLNPDRFKGALIAFIHITPAHGTDIKEMGMCLARMVEIQEVHYIAGQDELMLKVRVAGTTALDEFLNERIRSISTICRTKTSIVLSTYKETARIPLPDTYDNAS